ARAKATCNVTGEVSGARSSVSGWAISPCNDFTSPVCIASSGRVGRVAAAGLPGRLLFAGLALVGRFDQGDAACPACHGRACARDGDIGRQGTATGHGKFPLLAVGEGAVEGTLTLAHRRGRREFLALAELLDQGRRDGGDPEGALDRAAASGGRVGHVA